jgi:hypothetical protein
MRIFEVKASALQKLMNASQSWPRRVQKPTVEQRIETAFRAGWQSSVESDGLDNAWRRFRRPGTAEKWLKALQETGVMRKD